MKLLLLFMAHFLGDFVLQNATMADNKRESRNYFLLHCLVYSLLIFSVLIWFKPYLNVFYAGMIISLSHAAIDYFRSIILNKLPAGPVSPKSAEFALFIADQFLHLSIIVLASGLWLEPNGLANILLEGLLAEIPGKELYNGTVLAFLYILCLSPAAIFVKKVFLLFSFQENEETHDLIKSGYLIGILERIIILTLWLNAQLGTIGLIVAAKSLARFNQLNDRNFAEKYLVGTLLSVAVALVCITLGNLLLI